MYQRPTGSAGCHHIVVLPAFAGSSGAAERGFQRSFAETPVALWSACASDARRQRYWVPTLSRVAYPPLVTLLVPPKLAQFPVATAQLLVLQKLTASRNWL
jgi:hypothetical protein